MLGTISQAIVSSFHHAALFLPQGSVYFGPENDLTPAAFSFLGFEDRSDIGALNLVQAH
jgi:hypothetical protein